MRFTAKRLVRRIMIVAINVADWWLWFTFQTTKGARLEAWAYRHGWLEMWPGRKEAIEYYFGHKSELEEYWGDSRGCIIREKTRLQFENVDLKRQIEDLKSRDA